MHLGRKTEECLQELFVNFRAFGNGNVKELQKQKMTFVTSQPWAVIERQKDEQISSQYFKNRISFGDKYLYLVRREMTGYEPCLIGWCLWQILTLIFQLVSRCERRWSQDFQYCLAQRSLLLWWAGIQMNWVEQVPRLHFGVIKIIIKQFLWFLMST